MEKVESGAMHDIGGASRFMCDGVDTSHHALTDFDREVDAIRQILGQKKIMSVDELRRGIESLPEDLYFGLGYYQRWLHSMIAILIEKDVITEAQLAALLEAA